VREDWVFIDYIRAFMPSWLSSLMSMKVVSAVALALVIFVVVLKAVR
jgi:hypothetical protein